MSRFASEAARIHAAIRVDGSPSTPFSRVAADVDRLMRTAGSDRDSEWQRVNSYIADVLKDAHVLYSKLARLQGDFVGPELTELEKISDDVLDLGERLSLFMKSFHTGEANMLKESTFGSPDGGGAPPGTPPPEVPSEFEAPRDEEDFEVDLDLEGDQDFAQFEQEETEQQ